MTEQRMRVSEEGRMQTRLMQLARARGWLAFHPHRSEHSEAGFPDTVLVHQLRGIAWVECKIAPSLEAAIRKLTIPQRIWISALVDLEQNVYVWCPPLWDGIAAVLSASGYRYPDAEVGRIREPLIEQESGKTWAEMLATHNAALALKRRERELRKAGAVRLWGAR